MLALSLACLSAAASDRDQAEAILQSIALSIQEGQTLELKAFVDAQQTAVRLLRSRQADLRGMGARILSHVGNEAHTRPLTIALRRESDDLVRMAIVNTLGEIRDARAIPALVKTVKVNGNHSRPAALRAIVTIGGRQAEEALKRLLKSTKKVNVQAEIRRALKKLRGT